MIEFFCGDKTLAFIVSADGVNVIDLENFPAAEVVMLAQQWHREYAEFRKQMDQPRWSECLDDILMTLHERLFAPLKEFLPQGIRHLVFIPHRFLHLFPLHAMFRLESFERRYRFAVGSVRL